MEVNDIMKQAQQMQDKMLQIQNELTQTKVIGISKSDGGLTKVLMTGMRKCLNTSVDISLCTPDKKAALQKSLIESINDAMGKIEQETEGKMSSLTQGLDFPPGLEPLNMDSSESMKQLTDIGE